MYTKEEFLEAYGEDGEDEWAAALEAAVAAGVAAATRLKTPPMQEPAPVWRQRSAPASAPGAMRVTCRVASGEELARGGPGGAQERRVVCGTGEGGLRCATG
jgi:hypothetical protein